MQVRCNYGKPPVKYRPQYLEDVLVLNRPDEMIFFVLRTVLRPGRPGRPDVLRNYELMCPIHSRQGARGPPPRRAGSQLMPGMYYLSIKEIDR